MLKKLNLVVRYQILQSGTLSGVVITETSRELQQKNAQTLNFLNHRTGGQKNAYENPVVKQFFFVQSHIF